MTAAGRLPGGAASLFGLGVVFLLLLLSRDPRLLLQAELWGDDGWSWYPDAYHHGLAALLVPVGGYLNTLQRLGGLAGQAVPLRWAPTLFAAMGLAVQVLPPLFIASGRMAASIPSAAYRLLIAATCLMLPNTIEAHGNLTNSQWHLAVLALLVLVAAPPVSRLQRGFDAAVLLVCGLSGPFCVFLAPVAALRWWRERSSDAGWKLVLLGVAVLVQAGFYLASPPGTRSAAPLAAGPRMLARILATQVLLGAETGYSTIRDLPQAAFWQSNTAPLALCAAASGLAAIALWRGGRALRGLCLFALLLLAAALARPQASATDPQWPVLAIPPMGNRYFLLPMLAWMAVVFTLAADRSRMLRATGILLLLLAWGWGVRRDWRYLDFPRTDFVARAEAFARAPAGTVMSFPQIPPGTSPMWLTKR